MNNTIKIFREPISLEDFIILCKSVGWKEIPSENYDLAISNSIACVHAQIDGKIVGFARLVGDIGLYLYVQDVIVHLEYQSLGIGTCLMNKIHDIINEMKVTRGKVNLIVSLDACKFYEKLGYTEAKPVSKFMVKIL